MGGARNVVLDRGFSKVPSSLVRVYDPSRLRAPSVRTFLGSHSDSIPDRIYPDTPDFLKKLLYPEVEHGVVGTNQHTRLVLFGGENLLSTANMVSAVRSKVKTKQEGKLVPQIGMTLNVGLGSDGSELVPTFPAYLELGIQRHRELLEAGFLTRLRFFSTAPFSIEFHDGMIDLLQASTQAQKEMMEAYLERYYPDLWSSGTVSTSEVDIDRSHLENEDFEPTIQALTDRIHEFVDCEVLDALRTSSTKYTGSPDNGIPYAAYHCLPFTFRDGAKDSVNISIGGAGEYLFNLVRFNPAVTSEQAGLGLVMNGLVCRTPPYLRRSGLGEGKFELTIQDISSSRLSDEEILRHSRPESKELRHILRCIRRTSVDRGCSENDALDSFKSFLSRFN